MLEKGNLTWTKLKAKGIVFEGYLDKDGEKSGWGTEVIFGSMQHWGYFYDGVIMWGRRVHADGNYFEGFFQSCSDKKDESKSWIGKHYGRDGVITVIKNGHAIRKISPEEQEAETK